MMFFVGHIAVAFILCYVFIRISSERWRETILPSFALIMLFSIAPDIDIIFREFGFDLGHRTFTHSLILFLSTVFTIFLLVIILFRQNNKKRKKWVFLLSIYASAYLGHILIGDTIIGPLNILFPYGNLNVESGINANSLLHILIEFSLLVIMFLIVIEEYINIRRSGKKRNIREKLLLFRYSNIDSKLLYPLLILALFVSFIYLIEGNNKLNIGNTIIQTISENVMFVLIIVLYASATILITFIWLKSKYVIR